MRNPLFETQRPTALLVVIIAAVTPLIMRNAFWIDNSVLFAIFSLFALSVGMSYGQAGVLSIATGAFAAIGGFSSAIATTRYGLSPYLGLILSVALPAVLAYPIARIVTRLSPLPLSIATLVLSSIIEIAIREGGDFTGGYIGLSGIPPIPFASTPFCSFAIAISWIRHSAGPSIRRVMTVFARSPTASMFRRYLPPSSRSRPPSQDWEAGFTPTISAISGRIR
jgi:ABC-type branched-subunit amino acid transport system permease subunit